MSIFDQGDFHMTTHNHEEFMKLNKIFVTLIKALTFPEQQIILDPGQLLLKQLRDQIVFIANF